MLAQYKHFRICQVVAALLFALVVDVLFHFAPIGHTRLRYLMTQIDFLLCLIIARTFLIISCLLENVLEDETILHLMIRNRLEVLQWDNRPIALSK